MFALMPWNKRMPVALPESSLGWRPEEVENLLNRFFNGWPVMETPEWPNRWAVTTEEKEKEYLVKVELPGFKPEEVKMELIGDRLTVEAEHTEPAEKPEEKSERIYAKRVLTLPTEVEAEKVEVFYRNGVLEVHLPRKPETVARKIELKT